MLAKIAILQNDPGEERVEVGPLGRAEQPFHQLREMAEEHVPIWRTVRREFLKNLGREKAARDARNGQKQ